MGMRTWAWLPAGGKTCLSLRKPTLVAAQDLSLKGQPIRSGAPCGLALVVPLPFVGTAFGSVAASSAEVFTSCARLLVTLASAVLLLAMLATPSQRKTLEV